MAAKKIYQCGSQNAWAAHKRRHEPIDDECRKAHNAYARKHRAGAVQKATRQAREVAIEALIHRHREEYETLLRRALAEREPS